MRGNIRQRGKQSWEVRVEIGKDANGQRQFDYTTVRGSRDEAEQTLTRRLRELDTGQFVETSKLTVGDFYDRWLTTYAEANLEPKTVQGYESIVAMHLKPAFGSVLLQKLTPFAIQSLYSRLLNNGRKDGHEGGLSASTVLHIHRLMSEAFKMAVRWQLLPRNPCDAVTPPKVEPREVQAKDEVEIAWLIEATKGTRLFVPCHMAAGTGMRRGEVLAAPWSNINWKLGTLLIDRALSETKKHGCFFKKPKGRRSRTVALPPLLLEVLRQHREEQQKNRELLGDAYQSELDLICCRPDGSIWPPSAFTSAYRALLKRRGVTYVNFHAIRHSHASQSLRDGVDMKTISQRLGHARTSFTMDEYCHLMPGQDDEAARRTDVRMRAAMEKVQQQKQRAN